MVTTKGMQNTSRSVSMTSDRSIEEPCEATSLTHGFEAERRGRPLRLGSALYEQLKMLGLPIETGSGGLTKWNRTQRDLPKAHRQMCLMDRYGFPRTKAKRRSARHSFRTGDIVRAVVPAHLKNAGTHVGRMAAKAKGSFTIATATGPVTDISHRYCTSLQRADGYGYLHKKGARDFLQNQ